MKFLPKEAQAALAEILPQEEIFQPSSDNHIKESKVWAAQKQGNPAVFLRPSNATRLQKLVPYLYGCGGMGSSSAQDVVLSMSAFNSFKYNPEDHTIVVGGGSTWGHVEQELAKVAPGRIGRLISHFHNGGDE